MLPAIATGAGHRSSPLRFGMQNASLRRALRWNSTRCRPSSGRSCTSACRTSRASRRAARAPSPTGSLSSPLLDDWLRAVVATPSLTALRDLDEARRALLDDSLRGVELVRGFDGPIVDVGSGGGVPGIPLAVVLPDREVTLVEADGPTRHFLRRGDPAHATGLPWAGAARRSGHS